MSITKYVSFKIKEAIVESTINACFDESEGHLKYNPMVKELFFHINFIEQYTDIRFTENLIEEYDKLCENKELDKIIKQNEKDYFYLLEKLDEFVEAKFKEQSVANVIAKLGNSLLVKADEYFSPANIKKLTSALKKLDPEVVSNVLKVVK